MPLNFLAKKAAPKAEVKSTVKTGGLKFGSKKPAQQEVADEPDEPEQKPVKKVFGSKAQAQAKPQEQKSKLNFLKKGDAAKAAFDAEEAKAAQKAQEAGKMFRFWMKPGEDRTITFLDGDLGDDGLIDSTNYYDHQVKVNGEWKNFVCTADVDTSQPCPICEKGDSKPTLVALFTVIDHTPHTIQHGDNAGKVIENSRKLFVCKMKTLKLLNKIASKREGLTGCTFDVSRTGDKEPNVGNNFTFDKKWDLAELAEACELTEEDIQPADYSEEITGLSPEELIKMGVGKSFSGVGVKKNINKSSLKDQM